MKGHVASVTQKKDLLEMTTYTVNWVLSARKGVRWTFCHMNLWSSAYWAGPLKSLVWLVAGVPRSPNTQNPFNQRCHQPSSCKSYAPPLSYTASPRYSEVMQESSIIPKWNGTRCGQLRELKVNFSESITHTYDMTETHNKIRREVTDTFMGLIVM